MTFAIYTAQTTFDSSTAFFVDSNTILNNTANTALAAAAAGLTGFTAEYGSGNHGIANLTVQMSASIGQQGSANGVWITPTVELMGKSASGTVTVSYAVVVTFDEPTDANTTINTVSTTAGSPPVAAAGASVGPLRQNPMFSTTALTGFAIGFNDGNEHDVHDLQCYVGGAPSAGKTVSVFGAIGINDSSQNAGVAGVDAVNIAWNNTADGSPFLQVGTIPIDTLGDGSWTAVWSIPGGVVPTVTSFGVLMTGFSLSLAQNDDTEISSLAVRVTPAAEASVGVDSVSFPVTANMSLFTSTQVSGVVGSVSVVAMAIVAPSATAALTTTARR